MKSRIYIIISALLWVITGLFVDYFSAIGFSSLQLVGFRAILSAAIVGIWLIFKNKKLFKVKLKDLWLFFGSGVISFSVFAYLYYVSMAYNGLAIAAILLYTAPIFVAVLSVVIFKSKFDKYKASALTLSVIGCVLVSGVFSGGENNFELIGIIIGLGSGLGYALYSIFGKLATRKNYSGETIAFYTFIFASAFTLPLSLMESIPKVAFEPKNLTILLAYSLLTGALPYIFYTKGLEKTEPPTASIIATAEPMLAAVLGITVLSQPIEPLAVVGILLILVALIICAKKS